MFGSIEVAGLDTLRRALDAGPTVLVSNHTSWWDPMFATMLTHRVLRCETYAMMLSSKLEQFPFFGRLGAFGIDPEDPHDVAMGLRLAKKHLKNSGQLVWIFPQGEERPITERPLVFRPAAASLARIAPHARTMACALRYEFGAEERPTLLAAFSTVPKASERDAILAAQVDSVTELLGRIETHLREPRSDFEQLHPRAEQSEVDLPTRLLARVARYS
jgi:putative hemolysin